MPKRLPTRRDHIRHIRSVDQWCRTDRELPVFLVDLVDHSVELVTLLVPLEEQVRLHGLRLRVHSSNVNLIHPLASPVPIQEVGAEFVDQEPVITGEGGLILAPDPVFLGQEPDAELLGLELVLAQPVPDLHGHVHQVDRDRPQVPGIRRDHFPVADGLGGFDLLVQLIRVLALGHVPDAPSEVPEAPGKLRDGELGHIPAVDHPSGFQIAANAFLDATEVRDRYFAQYFGGAPRLNDGQAIGLLLLGRPLCCGFIAGDAH